MNNNIFNKQLPGRNDIERNNKKPSNKEGEMLMNLWDSGTNEERMKLAYALLNMVRDTSK